MLGRSPRVVAQAREAEVGSRPIEQSERARLAGCALPDAVRNLVAEVHQLVRREESRQLGRADIADLDPAVLDHIGVGDLAA